MKTWRGIVTQGYTTHYPDPIAFQAGEVITLGRRDPEWPGWVWCTSKANKSGWVPEEFLTVTGQEGRARRDYTALELNVEAGELVQVGEEVAEWVWATNALGKSGWIPAGIVRPVEERPQE